MRKWSLTKNDKVFLSLPEFMTEHIESLKRQNAELKQKLSSQESEKRRFEGTFRTADFERNRTRFQTTFNQSDFDTNNNLRFQDSDYQFPSREPRASLDNSATFDTDISLKRRHIRS